MGTWNAEWLNQNAYRAYPFREDCSRTDSTGAVTLPNNLFVDLCLVVPGGFDDQLYLRRLIYAGTTIEFSMALASDVLGARVAGFSVDLSSHQPNMAYNVVGVDEMSDIRGRAVLGDLTDIAEQLVQGDHVFESAAAPFECRAVRPDLRGLRSIRVVKADGSISSDLFGILEVLEGSNIVLTYVPATGLLPHGLRVDSLATDLEEPCECDASQVKPDPIRSINGVSGDVNGNIVLEPMDECIDISAGDASLKIDDKCAKPCCGCPEQEFITQQLAIMKTSIESLLARAAQVESAEINFYTKVLSTLK